MKLVRVTGTLTLMARLFIALDLPALAKDALSQLQWGLDDAHWRDPDGFHLTLAFLGEVDGLALDDGVRILSTVEAPAFDLTLRGVDVFGGIEPRTVWVGIEPSPALITLQKKISHALRREHIRLDDRRFAPHVTLASVRTAAPDSVNRFAASHGLFRFGPFPVGAFHIFESLRGKDDAVYEIIASFALSGGETANAAAGDDQGMHDKPGPVRYGTDLKC